MDTDHIPGTEKMKRGPKIKHIKSCRVCKKTITRKDTFPKNKNEFPWPNICKKCSSLETYLGQWKRKGVEAVRQEIIRQKKVLEKMEKLVIKLENMSVRERILL